MIKVSGGKYMEYTIKKLAEMAGVSARTLRYYDEIGLLTPCRINSSGYRIYGQKEVDLLQQILLYRAMDLKLEEIQQIISKPNFDISLALRQHHQELISRRKQLDQVILTVEKTLAYHKGEIEMSNTEKFEAFKKDKLDQNEAKYGKEIRDSYGENAVEASNQKFMKLNEEDFKKLTAIENEMFVSLEEVIKTKDLQSDAAKSVYEKHKAWLSFYSPAPYQREYHTGLAEMYVADERFAKYYNERAGEEAAKTLRDIIVEYAK